MNFSLSKSIDILERTPAVLNEMLQGLTGDWTSHNEGRETWSVYDIVGHLVNGEETDWIPRLNMILSEDSDKTFKSFDRFAQFEKSKGKTLQQILYEFRELRVKNLDILYAKKLTTEDLARTAIHPAFGIVTLAQLIATWAVHDLNHIAQICRVMSKQYQDDVGPWKEYLGILH